MSMGLNGDALMQYALAVLGYISGAGAHSFHEIMLVLRVAGVNYTPGSYDGCYPANFQATFEQLKTRFPDLFPPGSGNTPGGGPAGPAAT
jgi:hypothetical protein